MDRKIQIKKFALQVLRILINVFFIFCVFLSHLSVVHSQTSDPNTVKTQRIITKIKLDGRLDEEAWSQIQKISNFTQRELKEGDPVTERTEVGIVYTEKALYIGVWCYDSEVDKIVHKEMKRDFSYGTEDNFKIIIDTYHDRRNGYLFVINPNAARADMLITNEGKSVNKDWNGVWDVAVDIHEKGWFAEIEIPFSTLKFPEKDTQTWGINFERNISRKKEQVLWQGWSRDHRLERVSQAGTLLGLEGVSSGHLLEMKPYFSGGLEKEAGQETARVGKIGGDINYLLTSNLKLNMTLNTDFAQVESDRAQINLTRFSLYFPEKREFFLEGQGSFDFGLGSNAEVFYSRRIGIKGNQQIPIIGGARLIGKSGRTNIGMLSIQTAKKEDEPTTNYSVIRISQDVMKQSNIGFIFTSKNSSDVSNFAYGIDANYVSSRLFGDKNIAVGGAVAQSQTKDQREGRNLAYRFYLSYPNDLIEGTLGIVTVQKDFNPEIGFLRRQNYKMIYSEVVISPRPKFIPWIRQMEFKPIEINYYMTDDTNQMESVYMEWLPLGFGTKSGEWFEYNITRNYDRLDHDFEIFEVVEIPMGDYWYTRQAVEFSTFRGRKISFGSDLSWGDYYSGSRTGVESDISFNVNKHLNLAVDYEWNKLNFDRRIFTTKELGARIEYAFTTKLYTSFFGQWNNEDNEILLNLRLNWIPKIGSDFYLVINQKISTGESKWTVEDTTILLKFVWRFSY